MSPSVTCYDSFSFKSFVNSAVWDRFCHSLRKDGRVLPRASHCESCVFIDVDVLTKLNVPTRSISCSCQPHFGEATMLFLFVRGRPPSPQLLEKRSRHQYVGDVASVNFASAKVHHPGNPLTQ